MCYSCLHGLNAPAVFNKGWFQWPKPKPGSNTLIGQKYFPYSPCASTTVWLSGVIVYSMPSLTLMLQTTFNKNNTGRHALHYQKKKKKKKTCWLNGHWTPEFLTHSAMIFTKSIHGKEKKKKLNLIAL